MTWFIIFTFMSSACWKVVMFEIKYYQVDLAARGRCETTGWIPNGFASPPYRNALHLGCNNGFYTLCSAPICPVRRYLGFIHGVNWHLINSLHCTTPLPPHTVRRERKWESPAPAPAPAPALQTWPLLQVRTHLKFISTWKLHIL